MSLVPTRRVTVRDAIRLPVAQTVKLDKGEATAEVMPSTTQWVWRVSELVAGGIVRYVEVPDKESAEYSGLVDVDPATLDQSSETVAAWETVTRAAQAVLDQIGSIDDKVARAESSAQAAKASEGVTVLTRLCGFNDRSLVTLLQNAGLPLVFAATDHPY